MSKFSQIAYSSNSSFGQSMCEKESLVSQIDRLNQVIQSLASETLSPDISRYLYSPSLDSLNDFSKASVDDYEEDPNSENLYKGIEDIIIELDRVFMIREDFRSMELRRFEKYEKFEIEKEENENVFNLELDLEEINQIVNEFRILMLAEFTDVFEKDIKIRQNTIRIRLIKGKSEVKIGKNHIFDAIAETIPQESLKNPDDFHEFRENLEENMKKSFFSGNNKTVENTNFKKSTPYFSVNTNEVKSVSKQDLEQRKIIEKLEWQCLEVNVIKDQCEKRLQRIKEEQKQFNDLKNEIKKDEAKVQTKKYLLAKDLELISQQKIILSKIREENQKRLGKIKSIISEFTDKSFSIENSVFRESENKSPIICDQKSEIDSEILSLQNEILSLESKLRLDETNSESIQTKIDRLKNQQSKLKTLRVMKAYDERSHSFASRFKFIKKNENSSQNGKKIELGILSSSNKVNTENVSFRGKFQEINLKKLKENEMPLRKECENKEKIQNDDTKKENNLEHFENYIKFQENKLIEREEELNKRENMLLKALGHGTLNIDQVSALSNEQRNLKILRKDLEKRKYNLEKDIFANDKRSMELMAKEKDFNKAIYFFENFVAEQNSLENKMQMLFNLLQNIGCDSSRTHSRNNSLVI